ncbi:hypothetical protein KAX02_05490 [candidate division WOR-3 bacterium]|nr:hypothetical protein [candidate division WOR-3 bacterium]
MTQSNKFIIAKYIDDNKADIIQKCNEGMPVYDIAELYGVANSTIYLRLVKWGVRINKYRGARGRRLGKPVKFKRKFSPEFLAHQAEITRLNEGKIKYIEFERTTEDQRLIRNIIQHPIIG